MKTLRALAALVVVMGLSSCGGSDDPAPEGAESIELLAEQVLFPAGAGIVSVEASQTPLDDTTKADPLDADLWSVDISVVMAENATTDQVASAAKATRAFSDQLAGAGRWSAHVFVGAIGPVPGEDRTEPGAVQVEIYPTVRVSATDDARAAMEVKAIAGVERVSLAGGVAHLEVAKAKSLDTVLRIVRSLPLWNDGGHLDAELGRVRIADVPERVTLAQIHAITAAAIEHPRADFALESSGRSPELYVNHVTAGEARDITAAFTTPSLAKRNDDGFELEFNIRAVDSDESTVDSHGTFGQR